MGLGRGGGHIGPPLPSPSDVWTPARTPRRGVGTGGRPRTFIPIADIGTVGADQRDRPIRRERSVCITLLHNIRYDHKVKNMPVLAINKQALYDYEILDRFEAGMVLTGQEVKSIKQGGLNLKNAFVTIKNEEAYLTNARVSPYVKAGRLIDYDPERPRKLLLHKKELRSLTGKLRQKGLTMVPLKAYTKGQRVKVEIGVGRGKKEYDKRQTIKKREIAKQLREAIKRQT